MEARHLLKQLKDDGWYLGDTEGASRQYIHPEGRGVITVCVRFTDELGPDTLAAATTPARKGAGTDAAGAAAESAAEPAVVMEKTRTGVSAYAGDVTGCVATGAEEADARERLAEAWGLHMRRLRAVSGGAAFGDS